MNILINPKPFTGKAKSLIDLDKGSKCIPPTFICSHENEQIDQFLSRFVQENEDYSLFYIRLCFSDYLYPHCLSRLSNARKVSISTHELIQEAINMKIDKYDVLIQPLIKLRWSGAIYAGHNRLLIESVHGAPPLLFRNGMFNTRYILQNNIVLMEEICIQNYKLVWDSTLLKWTKTPVSISDEKLSLSKLLKYSYKENALYEFGIDDKDRFYLFEYKMLDKLAYPSLNKDSFHSDFIVYASNQDARRVHFEYPSIEYIKSCRENHNYIVDKGAYTSHLATYLINKKIGCVFSKSGS